MLASGLLKAQKPNHDFDKLQVALNHISAKEYNKAEIELKDYLSSYPMDEYALNGLGIIKYREGKIDSAIKYYNKSITIKPDFLEPYENRANAKIELHDVSGALDDINYVISKDSSNSASYINRGLILLQNKDTSSAFEDFDKGINLGAHLPEAYSNRGICYWYEKNLKMALSDLKYATAQFPNFPYAHVNYGIVLLEGLNDVPNAHRSFATAYNLGMRDKELLFKLGYTSQLLGDYDDALLYFGQFIELDSSNADVYFNLATILAYQKKYDLALRSFDKSLGIAPHNTDAITNRALLVYEPLGELNKAIEEMKMVIEIQENNKQNPAYAYNNLGYLQLKNDTPEAGLKNVEYSIKLDSTNSYAFKNLALIQMELNELESACSSVNKAIELGFINKYGKDILEIKDHVCN